MEMTQNATQFKWTANKARAAQLIADGRLTDEQIGKEVGKSRSQIARWKTTSEFAARVQQIVSAAEAYVFNRGVAKKVRRVEDLDDRWRRLHDIIEARAKEYAGAPGGVTGLLVRRIRSVGSGQNAREIEEYELDTGLLKELREIEKQVAKELGQLENKPAGLDSSKQADRDFAIERIIADPVASELACRLFERIAGEHVACGLDETRRLGLVSVDAGINEPCSNTTSCPTTRLRSRSRPAGW